MQPSKCKYCGKTVYATEWGIWGVILRLCHDCLVEQAAKRREKEDRDFFGEK